MTHFDSAGVWEPMSRAEAEQDELDETTCAGLLELQLSFDVASALSPSPDATAEL